MTQVTKAQLVSDLATDFPDNTVGAITAAIYRSFIGDFLDSYLHNVTIIEVTANRDVTSADDEATVFHCKAASAITLSLDESTGFNNGFNFVIHRNGAAVTIAGHTNDTINGSSADLTINSDHGSLFFTKVSDGRWFVMPLAQNFLSITEDYFMLADGSGGVRQASVRESSTQIISSKEFVTTPTSLIFGEDGAEISSAGQALLFEGTDDDDAFVITNKFDPTNGTATFIRSRAIARAEYEIQPLKDVTSSMNPTFTYTVDAVGPSQSPALDAEDRRHTEIITVESADTGEITAVFREGSQSGRLLRTQTESITADTETAISLVKPICLEIGTVIHVTITGNIRLKGTMVGPDFVPFLKVTAYLGYNDQIVTVDTLNDLAGNIRDALQSLTGGNRLARSAIYQEIVEIDDAAVTNDDYTISSSDNGKLLIVTRASGTNTDIVIPGGIEVSVSFFDVVVQGLGDVRVTGASGEGVRINDESDISFDQHEGGRISKTLTANRWIIVFEQSSTAGTGSTEITVEDDGVEQGTTVDTLNFTGDGVTATVSGNEATINIPGGSSPIDTIVNHTATGVQNYFGEVSRRIHLLADTVTAFDLGTGATWDDDSQFAIYNGNSSAIEFDISAVGLSFDSTVSSDAQAYDIPGESTALFFIKSNVVYKIADADVGGDTDHPVILTRDTPPLTDLNLLAQASLNDNSALWVLASDQVSATESGVDSSIMIRALEAGIPDANGDDISTTQVQKSTVVLAGGTIVRIFSSTDLRVVSAPGAMPAAEMYPDIAFTGSIRLEESDEGLYNTYVRRTATNPGGTTNQYIALPSLHTVDRPSWVREGDVFLMRHTGTATGSLRPAIRADNTGDNIATHGTIAWVDPGTTLAVQAPRFGLRTWQLFPVSQRSDGGTYYDPEVMMNDWYRDNDDIVATDNSVRLHHKQELADGVVRDHVKSTSSTNNPVTIRFQSRDLQDDIAWIEWFSALGAAVPALGSTVAEIEVNAPTSLTWIENNIADSWQFELSDPDVIHSISYITFISGETVKIGFGTALADHIAVNDVIQVSGNSFAGNNGDWAITTIYGDRLAVNVTIPGSSSSNDTGASGTIARPLYATSALVADDIRQHNFNLYHDSARTNPITAFETGWFDIDSETAPDDCLLTIGYNTDVQTTGSQAAVQDEAGDFFSLLGGSREPLNHVDNETAPVTTGTALSVSSRVINIDTSDENLFYIPEFPDEIPLGESRRYDIYSMGSNDIGNVKVAIGDTETANQIAFDQGPKELTVTPGESIGVELYNDNMNNGARLYRHSHWRIESNVIYPTLTTLPSVSFLLPFTSANINNTVSEDPHGHIFDFSTDNRVTVKAKGRYTFNTSMRMWFVGNEPSGLMYATPLLTPYTTGNQALYPYTFSMPLVLSKNGQSGNGAYVTLLAVFDFNLDIDDWMEFEIQTAIPTGFTVSDFSINNFTFSITADIGG